jgi:fructoselysine 6-kinase
MHIPEIHNSGGLVSFDYADEFLSDGFDVFEQTIEHVDFAFFSFQRDGDEARDFLQHVVARGPKIAVATFGNEGSLVWDGTVFIHCGIMPSNLVNTIGAGDSYIAGFMHGILSGMDIADCMMQGASVAAETVSVFGPWPEKQKGGI